jgi:coenzyme Q-binding protein COQ10
MPSFRTTRKIRHSAQEMFDLVANIESYPQFLPLCVALRVRSRTEAAGVVTKVAEMSVGYKAIRETFTTRVACDSANRKIFVEYINGPFKHLENRWSFREQGDGACLVEFQIAYEFKSRALSLVMGGMFDTAFRKFSEAFERRADIVYGAPAA